MSTLETPQLVHVHADCLKDAESTHPLVPVAEPAGNDASARPELYEALEAQLWQGAPQQAALEATVDLMEVADVGVVLHPVAGIELDA